jgi:hypothetical protein
MIDPNCAVDVARARINNALSNFEEIHPHAFDQLFDALAKFEYAIREECQNALRPR